MAEVNMQQLINPYVSSIQNADEANKKMLEAVATAGTAGRKAFEQAQADAAAAQKEALARAAERERIAGLGVPQLGQGQIAETFGRHGSVLANRKADFDMGLQGTQASNTSYIEKVKAAGPLLEQINQGKVNARESEIKSALELARQQAEAEAAQRAADQQFQLDRDDLKYRRELEKEARKAQADADKAAREGASKFPIKEVIGATEIAVEQAKGQLPGIQKSLDNETRLFERETGRLASVTKTLSNLEKKMSSKGWQAAYNMGDSKAMKEYGDWDRLTKESQVLNQRLPKRQAAIQSFMQQRDAINQVANNPTALSRQIAQTQYGRGAEESYGNLTDNTWQDILSAVASNDLRGISEQAKALAKKTNIEGGAKVAQEILGKTKVKETIGALQNLAVAGDTTWEEVDQALKEDFLTPDSKGVRQNRTYAILKELLRGLGWKK